MVDFFKVIIYEPLYNGLVFLVGVVPFGDLGLAVIILTILALEIWGLIIRATLLLSAILKKEKSCLMTMVLWKLILSLNLNANAELRNAVKL